MAVLQNGVVTVDGSETLDPVVFLGKMADGFSNAIGGLGAGIRQPMTFRVADYVAKNALASKIELVSGDEVFDESMGWWETYSGSEWRVTRTTRRVPFTPAITGINFGNARTDFFFTIDGDLITMKGTITFGSSTTVSGTIGRILLPRATWAGSPFGGGVTDVGSLIVARPNYGQLYFGKVFTIRSMAPWAELRLNTGNSTGTMDYLTVSKPFNWIANDSISFDLRYYRE